MRSTRPVPVTGYSHSRTIFGRPDRSVCRIAMISLPGRTTRSIAPPMAPPPIPGVVQLANDPSAPTW
jgi:hypothetical protein